MSRNERPLLARENSDVSSRDAEEEDALLTGQPTNRTNERRRKWRELGAWSWAAVATIVVIILAVAFSQEKALADQRKEGNCGRTKKPEGKRNLVFMVSDGMGATALELARSFRQYTENLPWNDVLTLDKHLIGQSRTRSSNSLITDSAAGATAFSCGFKSYNGAISILPDHTPCGTVLEAAKKAGYKTGLVSTTLMTDATPACFASHVQTRGYQDLIAEHLLGYYPLGRMVDVIIGGGRCHFLPNTTEGSCRNDDKDLVAMAKDDGWNYIDNMEDFNNLEAAGGVSLPLLALMSNGDIPFEIDRRHCKDEYPSQFDMADTAIKALQAATTDSEKGYFIMVEGARIDHAGHANDPAAHVHEVLMHDKTFNHVLELLEDDDTPGVLLSTSDHETGGLAAARQIDVSYPDYLWYPSVLANATNSATQLGQQWLDYLDTKQGQSATRKQKCKFLQDLIKKGFNFEATPEEIRLLIKYSSDPDSPIQPKYVLADMISRRAEIGWSTHGHSAADVNIYGSDPAFLSAVIGNHENIEIGRFMAKYLDVDVEAVTKELREKKVVTSPSASASTDDTMDSDQDVSEHAWEYAWTGPRPIDDEISLAVLNSHASRDI